ncbi:hypothetical protein BSLG_010700 [Batrachochytrium salamandrivorans]|nr:hypothetical protein BSLG_010700 [Batrachochytrium salamandrivorans]
MVAVSFVLVLALMSSTVWIPLDEETPTPTSDQDPADIGLSYILQQLNIQPDEFTRELTSLIVLGLPICIGCPSIKSLIENLHAAVHIKNGQVFFYSATTIDDDHALAKRSPTIPESTVEMSSEDAVKVAVDCLGVSFYNAIAPVKESYETDNGNILALSFRKRTLKEIYLYGDKTTQRKRSRGRFKGAFDPTLPPQASGNLVAGAVNAFYVTNMVHDVFYAYGFNEPAGNFQRDNFDRGGIDGDPVIINLQDSKRENYVSFDTSPDGQPGVLNLHISTNTKPHRDPALDNNPEDTRNTEKVIAEYIGGDSQGIRRYPYTTNMRINPLKYRDAVGKRNPHRLGEIWAVMLWEVYWCLVNAYGFSANLHDATQKKGNIIFLQLFVGTLMIQPCDPTFISAHHAMLAADDVYYGGIHKHLITKGFAKRGLDPVS